MTPGLFFRTVHTRLPLPPATRLVRLPSLYPSHYSTTTPAAAAATLDSAWNPAAAPTPAAAAERAQWIARLKAQCGDKWPALAAQSRASRERWIARLTAEHGADQCVAIVRESDERATRNALRLRAEHQLRREAARRAAAAPRHWMKRGRKGADLPPAAAAAAAAPSEAWAERVRRALKVAGKTGDETGTRAPARNKQTVVKVYTVEKGAEIKAAKAARGEAARNSWIAKLKAEHGDGWEAIVRESDERKIANGERIRQEHRLAKMGQVPKGGRQAGKLGPARPKDAKQADGMWPPRSRARDDASYEATF